MSASYVTEVSVVEESPKVWFMDRSVVAPLNLGHNLSGANHTGALLKALENEAAIEQLPVLLLLGGMALLGNVGNGVALYVYYTRFSPSSTRTYILAMSSFDLLFCSVTLPGEVLDLRFSLTYSVSWLCRLHRLISVSLTLVSAMILVAVALDRRRKICHPFRHQLTSRQVQASVLGCLVASLVIGFPFMVMNGRHSVKTHVPGLIGTACSVDDEFLDTSFPLIYNIILLLIFLVCVLIMSVCYAQIARKIVQHKRKRQSMLGEKRGGAGGGGGGDSAIIGSRQRSDTINSPQSSSHYDRSSDVDVKHHHHYHHRHHHHRHDPLTRGDSKVEDDVFAVDVIGKESNSQKKIEPAPRTAAIRETTAHPDNATPATKADPSLYGDKGLTFKSISVRKREVDLEMALRTLAHAVSENTLFRSSELFKMQPMCPLTTRPRSASVGESSPSSRRSAGFCRALPQLPGLSGTHQDPNDVKTESDDVKPSLTSPHRDVNHKAADGDKDELARSEENPWKKTADKPGRCFYERHESIQSKEDNHSRGVKRNISLKAQNDAVSNVRRLTVSEPHSKRLQSILHNTLARIRPSGGKCSTSSVDAHDVAGASTSSLRRRHWGKRIPSRTTWMMFVLTAIFIVSYLPYLALVCVRALDHDFETGLGGWQLNLYTVGLKSYFINSIVNPFVYSFCSARFRHQCRHLFRSRHKMSFSD